jgi:hypothetical protein
MTGLILGVLLSATLIGAMIVDWVRHPLPYVLSVDPAAGFAVPHPGRGRFRTDGVGTSET